MCPAHLRQQEWACVLCHQSVGSENSLEHTFTPPTPYHGILLLKYPEQMYSIDKASFYLTPEESCVDSEKIKTNQPQVKGPGGWGSSEGLEMLETQSAHSFLPNSGHAHQQEAWEKIQGGGNTQLSLRVRSWSTFHPFCLSSAGSIL